MNSISKLFLTSRVLCSPLEAIYTLLIFIGAGELHFSYLQLAALAASKPVSSLLSFYASSTVAGKPHHFKRYLIIVNTAMALPALAFPFIDNGWFYIFAFLIFTAGQRAVFPIWNALTSGSMTFSALSKLQGQAITIQQSIIIFCPLLFGYWMDVDKNIWRFLFFFLSFIQLINSIVLQFQCASKFICNHVVGIVEKLPETSRTSEPEKQIKIFSIESLIAPWKQCWKLLYNDSSFRQYHQLFFLGGIGLVMMQSTLPIFFKENLEISYSSIALAVSCCKGIALVASTNIWRFWADKISLFRLNYYINILSVLFVVFILTSNFNSLWIYPAYLIYGSMLSECEFSWNLCGPFFARGKESTLYASLNLPLVGIRGLIFPFVGQGILYLAGANAVFVCAGLTCFASILYARSLDRSFSRKQIIA